MARQEEPCQQGTEGKALDKAGDVAVHVRGGGVDAARERAVGHVCDVRAWGKGRGKGRGGGNVHEGC